jgi:hypothetical protein
MDIDQDHDESLATDLDRDRIFWFEAGLGVQATSLDEAYGIAHSHLATHFAQFSLAEDPTDQSLLPWLEPT